jgi:hypothetical protein
VRPIASRLAPGGGAGTLEAPSSRQGSGHLRCQFVEVQ